MDKKEKNMYHRRKLLIACVSLGQLLHVQLLPLFMASPAPSAAISNTDRRHKVFPTFSVFLSSLFISTAETIIMFSVMSLLFVLCQETGFTHGVLLSAKKYLSILND